MSKCEAKFKLQGLPKLHIHDKNRVSKNVYFIEIHNLDKQSRGRLIYTIYAQRWQFPDGYWILLFEMHTAVKFVGSKCRFHCSSNGNGIKDEHTGKCSEMYCSITHAMSDYILSKHIKERKYVLFDLPEESDSRVNS